MMKKLFNKKTMVIYIVVLAIAFIASCTSICFGAHYSNAFETSESKASTDTKQAVSNVLAGLITSIAGDGISVEKNEPTYDAQTRGFLQKRNISYILSAVFFVIMALFIAAAITAYQYPKYLESDKYLAKLKRLKKIEKNAKTS